MAEPKPNTKHDEHSNTASKCNEYKHGTPRAAAALAQPI